MTTKEKYELIDKTKINEKILTILRNMEQSSSNFTDEAVNSKIDGALEKLIEQIRANKPEALRTLPEAKKEVKKEKEKAIKKNEGKDFSDKKDTDDKTGLPKKDTLEERKDIIKEESETEKEARDRAKKELEKEKEKAKDEVESQIEKLNRLILEDPALQGFNTGSAATGGGRSTPIIDAERKALPRGSRVSQKGWMNQHGASKGGRKYWENRENRSDRKSPDYETGKPYLAKGGNVYSSDEMYLIAMFKGDVDLDTISIRAKNKAEARMIFENNYRDKYENELGDFAIEIYVVKPFPESDSYAQGGVIKAKNISDWDWGKIFEKVNLGLGESFVTILPKNPDGGKIKYGLIITDASNQFDRSSNISYIFDLDDKYYPDGRQSVKSTISSPYYDKDKYKEIARGSHLLVITIQGNRKTLLKDLIYKINYTFFSKINRRNEMDLPMSYPNKFLYDLLVFEGSISDLVDFVKKLQSAFQYEGAKLYTEPTPYIMSIIWNIPESTDYRNSVITPATYIPIFELANEVEAKTSKKRKYADGGEVEGVDLFEDYDDQPEEVQAILANYEMEDNDYETLQNLKAELESIGYTMEFGLDAEPYDLRKIGEKGKSEFYAKGGKLNTEVVLTENRSNGAKWRGVVKPFMMKSIEQNQYGGGFKRYEIDIYDDKVEREPSKEELKEANEFFDKVGGRFAHGGEMPDGYMDDETLLHEFKETLMDTDDLQRSIKEYYVNAFPTDDEGFKIEPDANFAGLNMALTEGDDVYKYLGVTDSLVRERVFEKLSEILGVDYDVVYNMWLRSDNYAKGGETEDYYENLAVYVRGVGEIYRGTSMKKALAVANDYKRKNTKAKIVVVDDKIGDEYDLDGNLTGIRQKWYFEYAKGGMMADGGKLDEEISKIKSLGGHWQSYDNGRMAGKKDDGYVTIENEADLNDYIYDKTGYIVKNIEVIEKEKNYPYNRSNPYFYDTYLVTLKNGSNFTFERSYGRPNWQGNVNYIERIKITNINTKHAKGGEMADGGEMNKSGKVKTYSDAELMEKFNIDRKQYLTYADWRAELISKASKEGYQEKTNKRGIWTKKLAEGGETDDDDTEDERLSMGESVYFEVFNDDGKDGIIVFRNDGSRIIEALISGDIRRFTPQRYMSYLTKKDLQRYLNRDFNYVEEVDEEYVQNILLQEEKNKPSDIMVVKYPYPEVATTPDTLTIIKDGERVFDYEPITEDFTVVSRGLTYPDQIELRDFLEDSKSVSPTQYTPELINIIEVIQANEDINEIVNELKSKGLIKNYIDLEKGREMADGGEVEPKIYEINDGYHIYYFYGDNKAQVLKYFKMVYHTNKYEQNISIKIMTGSRLKHLEESEEYDYIEDARVVDNINEGDEMAHGGGIPYKPYGKTKGRFKLTYEVEGEEQSEIRESLEEATDSARRYVNPKLGYTNVHIYDESGKEYFFADGGMTFDGIGFIPMDLEENLMITAKWGGTNIKGVIGILNAMIDSNITDEDLRPKPTKTGSAFENAVAKKTKEIWAKIEPQYKGDFRGNMYYSTIRRLVERSTTSDEILKRYKPFRKYQKNSFASNSKITEGGYMADGGYTESGEKLYEIANNMSDKEFQEAYRNLSEKEKDLYESLLRLGDEEKIALVTVLNESKKPKYDKVTWDLHRYAKGGEMADGGKVDKRILEKVYENYDIYKDGTNREHYDDFDNIEKVKEHIEKRTGMEVLKIKEIEIGRNYPDNMSHPYYHDDYEFELVKGQPLRVERMYGRPNYSGNVAYTNMIEVKNLWQMAGGGYMADGGITPQLNDKVHAKAQDILKAEGITENISQKQFNQAYDKAIKEFGYSPAYFKKVMREFGSEYPDDDNGEFGDFMADGGMMADGGIRLRHKYSFVYEPMLYTFTVELNNSEDELFEFETMEQSFRFARVEEKEGNRITDVSKYKKIGFQRYEREQELLDKYKEWTPSIVDEIKINKSRGYRYADGGMMADGGKLDEEISKIKSLGGNWQSYGKGVMAGEKDDGYVTIENEADLNDYIYDKTGYIVKNIEVIEKGKKYPYNRSNPYFDDTYLVTLKNGSNFTFERSYGRPNWPEHVNYKERIKITNINTKQNKGDLMADGGEVINYKGVKVEIRPASKNSNKFIVWDLKSDQIFANEKFDSVADAKLFIEGNEMILVRVVAKDEMSKYADGGMMADGGEVDFNERMAKMRSAYENLNMIVKSRIAVAIGIDRAISIMERDYSIDPFGLITSAVRSGLLELDEINKDLVNEAVYEAERVTDDYRDSGQGIGGSDMTYFTKSVLDGVGYKTGFVNNRLTRVDADGNELVIDKYEMNY